jgi:hypothetical protein
MVEDAALSMNGGQGLKQTELAEVVALERRPGYQVVLSQLHEECFTLTL